MDFIVVMKLLIDHCSNDARPQDQSFPCFPFIVYESSSAMHSRSVALCFERRGITLVSTHLHKVVNHNPPVWAYRAKA